MAKDMQSCTRIFSSILNLDLGCFQLYQKQNDQTWFKEMHDIEENTRHIYIWV